MKERVNIRRNGKFALFPLLKTFNLQLMSTKGGTFSLFALMIKMFLSFFINFGCAKTVVGLQVFNSLPSVFFHDFI